MKISKYNASKILPHLVIIGGGFGGLTVANGDKYVGEFKDGYPNGKGKRSSPDGRNYVGEWKDGREHGQGTFTWADGKKYEGEWKDGKMWNGTGYDNNGNILYKLMNGKEMKQ